MASRPFAFGVRLRDKGRTVRVRARKDDPRRYVVEESRAGGRSRSREHDSLHGALRDLATSWRSRLH
ncbi:MAG: hypothetical protein QNK04_05015 [Myxococcota bacterium]|nr:hypothetical protein [Myxococcota bacterium]